MKQMDNRQKQLIQLRAQKPVHGGKNPGSLKDKHTVVPESDRSKEAVQKEAVEPVRSGPKIGRNDPCSCGSGKKYKKCCLDSPKK